MHHQHQRAAELWLCGAARRNNASEKLMSEGVAEAN